jgi:predicted MFS family arabinose efflux permease
MLRVLLRRDFALLWTGGFVSIAGDWVLNAALPFFVYERTESTVATAGMIVAELAPGVLMGSVAGVFVDRWDRKHVLVVSNFLQAATVGALLLVTRPELLWLVYAVAAVRSLIASFAIPAEGALLPTLVRDADLVPANALNALNNRLGRLVGAPLGGLLLAAVGLHGVVVVDCASFLLAAVLVAPIRAPRRVAVEGGADVALAASAGVAFLHEWQDGMRRIRGDRTLLVIFAVLWLMTFGGTMLDPLNVAWVRDSLDRGAGVYAWLLWTHAICGIVGTLIVGMFAKSASPRILMGWASVAAGLAIFVKYNVPTLPLAVALTALTGFTSVAGSVGVDTLLQRSVRDEHRGRVRRSRGERRAAEPGRRGRGRHRRRIRRHVTMLNVAAGLVTVSGVVVLWRLGSSDERSASPELSPDAAPDPVETVADRAIR